ncbi:hypothetical protein NJB18001_26900 [Mycobacterium marinum]|nr:hypothetical protein NJB18001_26900 [Mycobacterium marinum]
MTGIGDKPAGMAEHELDIRIPLTDAIAHQQMGRPGGVEQEVAGPWGNSGNRRAGQFGGMDEHHRGARIQRGEQVVLAVLAEIDASVVG